MILRLILQVVVVLVNVRRRFLGRVWTSFMMILFSIFDVLRRVLQQISDVRYHRDLFGVGT